MSSKKILFLGPSDSPLIHWLRGKDEKITQTAEKISPEFILENDFSFLISYGYRYILGKNILNKFPDKAINLHISYLPWNRGTDPNFWSFIENTPKGVTIHYLDEGVDTGDIIVQRAVQFDSKKETLATSYQQLHATIQQLFKENWQDIKTGLCHRKKQIGNGSTHKAKDKEPFLYLVKDRWNTSISVLEKSELKKPL